MSQVLPAEGGLRRVIGDGQALPDGEDLGDVEQAVFEAERDAVCVLV